MFTQYDDTKNEFSLVEEPDTSASYSYADYLKWKFEERVELIRGRMMKMTAPNRIHQDVSMNLSLILKTFLKQHQCKVYAAPFDVRLARKDKLNEKDIVTVVQPDLCVVCDEKKLDEKGCMGAPDLVVEILSPGNSRKEIKLKHEVYEEAGVKEYWIITPVEEHIAVFILNSDGKFDGAKLYTNGDIIQSQTVNNLSVNVTEVFQTN
jgi:Uma2 family endonuclease